MENNNGDTRYKIRQNSWLAKMAAWKLKTRSVAFVLGSTIHLHNVSPAEFLENKSWLRHELCHIRQFEQHGFFIFIAKYIWESIRHGYYNNKYEAEARRAENEE
ncbi:MAG: DUF4157 domain-containing protein [Rhizobacter sp.]|nr:DUF4157 domain-containing protein [Ferruginibacter sp.]